MEQIASLFYLSPSRIARFFYRGCERYLRYHATPHERWKADGIPQISWDTSPVTAAILKGGLNWVTNLIKTNLKGKVRVAPGYGPVHERAHDIKQTLSMFPRYNQILVMDSGKAYPIENYYISMYPLPQAGKEGYAYEE